MYKRQALIVNETEARGMLGETELSGEALMRALTERTAAPVVILTEGSRGARVCCRRAGGGVSAKIPCWPVEAVDTTGAGDTFTGYAVRALVETAEDSDPEAKALISGLRFAALAAALSVTKPGAAGSIPTRAEVEAEAEKRGVVF